MGPPNPTEKATLKLHSFMQNYQRNRKYYVSMAKGVVRNARGLYSAAKTPGSDPNQQQNSSFYIMPFDKVADLIKVELKRNNRWNNLLAKKHHIPHGRYDIITDIMARYITEDAYTEII